MKNLIYKYHEKWACKSTFSIVLNSLFPDFLPPFCRPGFRLYDTGAVRTVRLKRIPGFRGKNFKEISSAGKKIRRKKVLWEKDSQEKSSAGKKSQEIVEKK